MHRFVPHTLTRTEQKLASTVITYFDDSVDKNQKYLSVSNLALMPLLEKTVTGSRIEFAHETKDKIKCGVKNRTKSITVIGKRSRIHRTVAVRVAGRLDAYRYLEEDSWSPMSASAEPDHVIDILVLPLTTVKHNRSPV
ncbi:hypothetical protein EVAR_60890_1 [Eumeta japonica]|uniref:Uncharacterized protein n=1 Tax=Eumeta variegata TaxID=151549 RepID=A0A4C1YI52_EUMVA|nr:hypothetical protein EVAR_60890_1 [Eumeta japonica]